MSLNASWCGDWRAGIQHDRITNTHVRRVALHREAGARALLRHDGYRALALRDDQQTILAAHERRVRSRHLNRSDIRMQQARAPEVHDAFGR